jgi:hypothetical protein
MMRSFFLDSEFLEKCDAVDYSVLVIMDKARLKIKLGIIDYL